MTRAVPNQFASLTNPSLPNLDADFTAVVPGLILPCTAAGTNQITLTPTGTITQSAYTDQEQFSFKAVATSTGVMTAGVQALGFVKLFKAGGTTQATTGDVLINQNYVVEYGASLDSGNGGFVIVSAIPAPGTSGVAKAWGTVRSDASLVASFNVASVANSGAGLWTVTFTSAFSGQFTNVVSVTDVVLGNSIGAYTISRTSSTVNITTINTSTGTGLNKGFEFICMGLP